MADKQAKENLDLTQAVIAEYEATGSIVQVAKNLQMTKVKVQRILITEGIWSSKRSRQVAELREQGITVEEIAEKLNKDVKTIQTFLPYSRGQYGLTESYAAEKEREYRERKSNAAKGMVRKEDLAMDREFIDLDEAFRNGANGKGNINTKPHTEEELKENPFLTDASVYRLKLELEDLYWLDKREGSVYDDEERAVLHRMAKVKDGISREVLVPSSMNLHSVHYMIQRLFGWQNSHLHRFEISDEEFNALTCRKAGVWAELCGSLFHYVNDELSDMYWDDDYDESQSVKNWFRKKYVGPYIQKSVSETYIETKRAVSQFMKKYKIEPGSTFEELREKVYVEDGMNYLSERLTLGELLTNKAPKAGTERNKAYKKWCERLYKKKLEVDSRISSLRNKQRMELFGAMKTLKILRTNMNVVDDMIYYGTPDEVLEKTGHSVEEWENAESILIPQLEEECMEAFTDLNPKLTPLFDTLYYEYDFGDGWRVKITVLDKYDRKTNADLSTSEWFVPEIIHEADKLKRYRYFQGDQEVDEELRSILAHVDAKESPRCIASDGLNVLDDVGGVGGYSDMLLVLNGDDPIEKESMKDWARGMGWTGRLSKPENML